MKKIPSSTSKLLSKGHARHKSQQTGADPTRSGRGARSVSNSTLAELKQECSVVSSMLVAAVRALSCDIHDTHWLEQKNFSTLVYSPINSLKGEFRLLRVKEALFRADIVECDLITRTLGECEDFKALSYCWGSDKLDEVMLCNGKRHYISASLNAALKASRESAKIRDAFYGRMPCLSIKATSQKRVNRYP